MKFMDQFKVGENFMGDPVWKLGIGLLTGIGFGFLLQKAWVTKPRTIAGAFLGRDMTAAKVLLTASAVGSIGVWTLHSLGVGELEPKPMIFGNVIIGGALFGLGLVLFGYCPGTGVAASGEGRKDAMVGILGMFTGAGVYVVTYPWIDPLGKKFGNWGKINLPLLTEISASFWVVAFVTTTFLIFYLGEKVSRMRLGSLPAKPSDRYEDSAA
jgi:uncharacterized membrane protein YedE/YeeE